MPEPFGTPREERIRNSRQVGAERAPEVIARRAREQAEASERLRTLGPEDLRAKAEALKAMDGVESIGPIKDEAEWERARRACRAHVIAAGAKGERVYYDELRVLTFDVTQMTLGHSMFGRMCAELNDPVDDGCVISALVVTQETGEPGPGFLEFAREQGYDLPLATLQRMAVEACQSGSIVG